MPKTKIAIIEDEIPIQQMYKFKFEQLGYIVKTANNGSDGLELIDSFIPEIVLLDIKMPVMNGDEMLRILRDKGNDTKVIILSNVSKDEIPLNVHLLGIEKYILKVHHTPNQIIDIVKAVLVKQLNS